MLPADDPSIGSVTIRLGTMAGGAPYPACPSSIRPTLATTIDDSTNYPRLVSRCSRQIRTRLPLVIRRQLVIPALHVPPR